MNMYKSLSKSDLFSIFIPKICFYSWPDPYKCLRNDWIKMTAAGFLYDTIRLLYCHSFLVTALGYQGIEHICYRHDPRTKWNLFASKAIWITRSVPFFMLLSRYLMGHIQILPVIDGAHRHIDDLSTLGRMHFHPLKLLVRQLSGFL